MLQPATFIHWCGYTMVHVWRVPDLWSVQWCKPPFKNS